MFLLSRIQVLKLIIISIAGFIGALGFAPYYNFFLFTISFCVLINFLFKAKSYKESFAIGWLFGFSYFLTGLYWIAYPLIFYFLDSLWWLVPFAIILIPSILAIYHGLCALILYKCNNGNRILFAIFFLCIWGFI